MNRVIERYLLEIDMDFELGLAPAASDAKLTIHIGLTLRCVNFVLLIYIHINVNFSNTL